MYGGSIDGATFDSAHGFARGGFPSPQGPQGSRKAPRDPIHHWGGSGRSVGGGFISMGGLSDASGVLCSPVTAKVTKPRFSGFPGEG